MFHYIVESKAKHKKHIQFVYVCVNSWSDGCQKNCVLKCMNSFIFRWLFCLIYKKQGNELNICCLMVLRMISSLSLYVRPIQTFFMLSTSAKSDWHPVEITYFDLFRKNMHFSAFSPFPTFSSFRQNQKKTFFLFFFNVEFNLMFTTLSHIAEAHKFRHIHTTGSNTTK